MRHLLANIITYAIAALLFLGAALFARMRDSQYTLTSQSSVLAVYEPSPAREFRWQPLGEETYRRNCRSCHGADGEGWDQYTAVDGVAEQMMQQADREQLIDVQLYGLSTPDSRAPMPRMGHLSNVEIAAVLNYLATAFDELSDEPGEADLFTPDEIERRRR